MPLTPKPDSNYRGLISYKTERYSCISRHILITDSAAGAVTTGNTLTHLLKLLLTNERCWKKLCDEVRGTFTCLDEINSVKMRSLAYMDMVLFEGAQLTSDLIKGMRCGASGPFGSMRLTPPEGAIIAGVAVAGDVIPPKL